MERRQDTREDIKQRLGIANLPEPRYDAPDPQQQTGTIKLWKALQCVDSLDTAAFERYIPERITIIQSINPWSVTTENTFGCAVRTDVPIPSHVKVERATGIGTAINAHNHYLWLAQILGQHWDELEPAGCSQPLVWRTHGYGDTKPMLGLIFHLHFPPGIDRLSIGKNWGLMMENPKPL